MNDSITIATDIAQAPILDFVRRSALADITTTTLGERGAVIITSVRPVAIFSTGEQVAWALLRSMVSGELRRAMAHLDADNVGALVDCLASFRTAIAA